jgi:hypothetical protein
MLGIARRVASSMVSTWASRGWAISQSATTSSSLAVISRCSALVWGLPSSPTTGLPSVWDLQLAVARVPSRRRDKRSTCRSRYREPVPQNHEERHHPSSGLDKTI